MSASDVGPLLMPAALLSTLPMSAGLIPAGLIPAGLIPRGSCRDKVERRRREALIDAG